MGVWLDRRYAATALSVGLAATFLVVAPAEAASRCFGKRVTIKGTGGKDQLRGTPRADVIAGLGGGDKITGLGGDDLICGGSGHDELDGGAGRDKVKGQRDSDHLLGGDGNDLLRSGRGNFQFMLPGAGDDRVVDGPGPGFVGFFDASAPVDVDLEAGTATGEGNDTLIGLDAVGGSRFDDVLAGTSGPNFFEGGPGDDQIFTRGSASSFDSPLTDAEADFVAPDFFAPNDPDAPRGDDTVTGGEGSDVMLYDGAAEGVDVNLNSGRATGEGTDTLVDVDGAVGTQFDDTLLGNADDNAFEGLGGNNTITGGAGRDVTVYLGSVSGVTVNLSAGSSSGTFRSIGPRGREGTTQGTDALEQIENVWGSFERDALTGDGEANELYAIDGNDEVLGAAGDDLLDGGGGTDVLNGGDGTDRCVNGESNSACESTTAGSGSPAAAGAKGIWARKPHLKALRSWVKDVRSIWAPGGLNPSPH